MELGLEQGTELGLTCTEPDEQGKRQVGVRFGVKGEQARDEGDPA